MIKIRDCEIGQQHTPLDIAEITGNHNQLFGPVLPNGEATEIDERIRQVMNKHPRILLAVLFGSVARNDAGVDSDLDLAVSAGGPLDANEKMNLIMDLAQFFGRPVDLVDLLTVGEPLLGQIIAGGRKVLGDDSSYALILIRHLFEEADFMPYRRRILRERRRAWIGI